MALGPFEPSLRRMRAAIDLLEAAVERRARRDAKRGDADEELALMQDDRARLAVELDGALGRARALEAANAEAAKRLAQASAAIDTLIERAARPPTANSATARTRRAAMAQVTVTIGGHSYRLACNEGEEAHLEVLARESRREVRGDAQMRSAKSATSG